MISVIFRAVLILMVIAIVLAVIVNTGGFFGLTFNFATNEFLKSLLSVVCYIVPFKTLLPIFAVVISLTLFKISVSLLKTIWALFPLRP